MVYSVYLPDMQVHQSQNARLSQRDSLPSFDKILERKKFYSSTHKLAITKFPEVNSWLEWIRNKFTDVHRKVITTGLRNWRQNAMISKNGILPSFDENLGRKKFYSPTHKLAMTKFPEVNSWLEWVRNKFTNVHRKVITIGLRNWRQSAMISRNGILPSFDDFLGKKKFYSPTPKLVITKFAEVNNRLQWVRNKFNNVHTKIPTVCEFVPITNLGQDKCQVSDKESNTDATKEKFQITSVLENSKITNLEKFPKKTNLEKFQNKDLQKNFIQQTTL